MSFLSHLSRRLAEGEHAFLAGRIAAADECAHDVLRDLVSLTGRSGSGSSRLLRAREHECARGCVCEAAVLLALQCAAETRGPEAVDDIVRDCYAKPIYLPFNIFTVWSVSTRQQQRQQQLDLHSDGWASHGRCSLTGHASLLCLRFCCNRVQYEISVQRYEECCQQIIAYIDTHYSTAGSGGGGSSAIAPDLLLKDADPAVADARYVSLLEMLLFDVLVPLGSHDEAVSFLRRGRKARRGQAAPPRDERLAPHIKEVRGREMWQWTQRRSATARMASAGCMSQCRLDVLLVVRPCLPELDQRAAGSESRWLHSRTGGMRTAGQHQCAHCVAR